MAFSFDWVMLRLIVIFFGNLNPHGYGKNKEKKKSLAC